jgi:Fe-S-cluster containining protein
MSDGTSRGNDQYAMTRHGPLAGDPIPTHGGLPGTGGCNGCTDCCHLPAISVTDEEAERLRTVYLALEEPRGALVITPDSEHDGWQTMEGPCVFRRLDRPFQAGGCRIYEHRPQGCDIFTCRFLLEGRRSGRFGGT